MVQLTRLLRFPVFAFAGSSAPQLTARWVLKMVHEVSRPLDSCICQFAYFLTVETLPSSSVELLVKIKDELRMDEIDKGVADIAWVVVIDG